MAELGAFWDGFKQQLTPVFIKTERAVPTTRNDSNNIISLLHALQAEHKNVALEGLTYDVPEIWINSDKEPYVSTLSLFSRIKFSAQALALTKSGKNLVAIPDDGFGISILDFDGKVIRTFGDTVDGNVARCVCVDWKGRIWTCNFGEKKVSCYTEQGRFVDEIKLRFYPTAIVCFHERVVVAISYHVDVDVLKSDLVIYEFSWIHGWTEKVVIECVPFCRKLEIIEKTQEICVVHESCDGIDVYTSDGKQSGRIGHNLSLPVSVAVQGNDHIVVCQWTWGIFVWDRRDDAVVCQWSSGIGNCLLDDCPFDDMIALPYNRLAVLREHIDVVSIK